MIRKEELNLVTEWDKTFNLNYSPKFGECG